MGLSIGFTIWTTKWRESGAFGRPLKVLRWGK
jgi:hypothetical protein